MCAIGYCTLQWWLLLTLKSKEFGGVGDRWGNTNVPSRTKCARILFIIWAIAHQTVRIHDFGRYSVVHRQRMKVFPKNGPPFTTHSETKNLHVMVYEVIRCEQKNQTDQCFFILTIILSTHGHVTRLLRENRRWGCRDRPRKLCFFNTCLSFRPCIALL